MVRRWRISRQALPKNRTKGQSGTAAAAAIARARPAAVVVSGQERVSVRRVTVSVRHAMKLNRPRRVQKLRPVLSPELRSKGLRSKELGSHGRRRNHAPRANRVRLRISGHLVNPDAISRMMMVLQSRDWVIICRVS
jgi:hypothetical protein